MTFRTDKHTINDLELFSDSEKHLSIFRFYDFTVTNGGHELLFKLFKTPISDLKYIERRKQEISFFNTLNKQLKLNKAQFEFIEYYLNNRRFPLRNNILDAVKDGIANKFKTNSDYYIITQGILLIIKCLVTLQDFLNEIAENDKPASIKFDIEKIETFLNISTIQKVIKKPPKNYRKPRFLIINKLDHLFRVNKTKELRDVLDIVYHFDVVQSLGMLMREKHFTLPVFVKSEEPVFELTEGFHPFLSKPIKNCFSFKASTTLCFLTGPNMSGKSTFLKTIATLVYLSHLGIPIPAKKLRISFFGGLFTTINLVDNLGQGLSHFYAEVKRVKEMANVIQSNNKMVVVLDELFRGTNVKDAFEATLMVIKSLSQIKSSLFFVSSHIIEVAEHLQTDDNIDFRCFQSKLEYDKPVFDYKLNKGISKERLGMQIIKQEEIEEILANAIKNQNK